ncbi:MAG: pirin family protein [Deltaproteobacteria bacterium]|nr:pirin family protein [Deltaproteobacteria bacterium]
MSTLDRRQALGLIGAATAAAACSPTGTTPSSPASAPRSLAGAPPPPSPPPPASEPPMPSPILDVKPLGFPWQTLDPFLFCVHHDDHYPKGNDRMGPDPALLAGRNMGMDFEGKDGWRMYHGEVVPGFPQHPHRGFETVTVVRRGLLDHSDSMGAAARYGGGDVQWLTAGKGIIHAEMFPLLRADADNPVELFQIWLNLPARDKFAEPHFTMLWADTIPTVVVKDPDGRAATITMTAGAYESKQPPSPPPASWASKVEADVAIWQIQLEPGARWTLPPARPGTNRMLYHFRGERVTVADREVTRGHGAQLRGDAAVALTNGAAESELLLLQGRPIGEPVAQYGPFVMNTREQIQQAFDDYRKTRFGGWKWPSDDPVHPRSEGRFARRPDGTVERPG